MLSQHNQGGADARLPWRLFLTKKSGSERGLLACMQVEDTFENERIESHTKSHKLAK